MNDLNNPILLLRSHLVIARQTEPTTENISSYIDSRAFNISICTSPAVTLNRNKRVCPVYRLHMHWLPDWPTFGIMHFQCFQYFGWTGLASFRSINSFMVISSLRTHGILVDDHAGKPVVRLTCCCIVGIHLYGEPFESFFVSLVNCLLLRDMFLEVWELTSDCQEKTNYPLKYSPPNDPRIAKKPVFPRKMGKKRDLDLYRSLLLGLFTFWLILCGIIMLTAPPDYCSSISFSILINVVLDILSTIPRFSASKHNIRKLQDFLPSGGISFLICII